MSILLYSRGAVTRTPFGRRLALAAFALGTLTLGACSDAYDDGYTSGPQPVTHTVVTASGDIVAKLTEYRTLLGEPSNGATPGQQAAGRREINWDGVPAAVTNVNNFSGFFFNSNSPRGAVFTTAGTGFRVSDNDFGDLSADIAADLNAFSPAKTFAPVGSNVMDATFQVAGSPTPAVVSGFGVVFSDVDAAGVTKMEFFDRGGRSLGVFDAPVRTDAAGLSFLGVKFETAVVARVRIVLGQGAVAVGVKDLGKGGAADVVVVDDFLYGEPKAATF